MTATDLPLDWLATRREIVRRDGHALRVMGCTLQIKSLTTDQWLRLALPGDTAAQNVAFDSREDAITVMNKLV